jgi:hypothetical protein
MAVPCGDATKAAAARAGFFIAPRFGLKGNHTPAEPLVISRFPLEKTHAR